MALFNKDSIDFYKDEEQTKPRSVEDIIATLNRRLHQHKDVMSEHEYGFDVSGDGNRSFPIDYKWIAVYPVVGGSEGYYVHFDLIMPASHKNDRTIDQIGLAKFWSWEAACKAAIIATTALHAERAVQLIKGTNQEVDRYEAFKENQQGEDRNG